MTVGISVRVYDYTAVDRAGFVSYRNVNTIRYAQRVKLQRGNVERRLSRSVSACVRAHVFVTRTGSAAARFRCHFNCAMAAVVLEVSLNWFRTTRERL